MPDEAFARHLLKVGLVSEDDLRAARASGRPLPQVLVERGLLTPEQLDSLERKLRADREEAARLGPYRLLKKLGAGGMGTVYLAESDGRRVALKVLAKAAGRDADTLRRFLREVEAARRLDHPNIVRAGDHGEDRGMHYYAMEYVEGATLGARLKLGPLPPGEATTVVLRIANGLAYAHAQGFIHRDIKPDNVIVAPDGAAKILDMGLSKEIGADRSFLTSSGLMVGTPHYMAPEQARADKDIDGRADLYALGATYYHLVTGQPPFQGATAVEVIAQHLNKQLPDPSDVRDGIPDGVCHVIRKLMAKDRDDRYPDAPSLIADLEALVDGRGPESKPLDAAKSTVAPRRGRRRPPPPSSRAPLWIAGAAALAVGLVAFKIGERPAPPQQPPRAEPKAVVAEKPLSLDLGGGVALELIAVKPGEYTRGGTDAPREIWELDARPTHRVVLTRGFQLGKYEVTRRQFAAFVDASGYRTEAEIAGKAWGRRSDGVWEDIPGNSWRAPAGLGQTDEHPVVCVTWNDAAAFCDWLAGRHKREVRLPTEAEWEFACRAGAPEPSLPDAGWYAGNASARTQPVGRKAPNAWGFHDMLGNAWEWCFDWAAPYVADAVDPVGPARGDRRVMRGGAWYLEPALCRPSTRAMFGASNRYTSVGFRIALP